jgi:thiamine transport system permease protein
LLHLILFLLTAYVLPHDGWERFLNGYLAPSAAVTGFGLLLIPIEGVELVKLVVALTLISYPLLYRWIVHAALAEVQGQVITARTMGASWSQILFEIVWPQLAPALLRASGLAAVWACGDFALSGILLNGGSGTLPLLISDLISNYRIEVAAVLLLPLSLASIGLYVLFRGAARYVTN